MSRRENEEFLRDFFERGKERHRLLAAMLVDDAQSAVDEAQGIFDAMIPDMAYVDRRGAAMAFSVFGCSALLALYLALKKRGIDVHQFGQALLEGMATAPPPEAEEPSDDQPSRAERFAAFVADGEASLRDGAPGEFVFEVLPGAARGEWGMNIKSCAICHQFAKYDAMDLVPYMCATDDIESDRQGLGLRRHGTIALGAHQCDFRYARGGEPLRVAEQYPDRIRLVRD